MTDTGLIRLVYASRRLAEPARDLDGEIRSILMASIPNNRAVAITGLLVGRPDWFLQALEGPEAAVMQTYRRIESDPRHVAATVRHVTRGEARLFARWTMCARIMSDADETIIARLVDDRAFDPFACSEAEALDLLTTVGDIHGQLLTQMHADLLGEVLRAA